MVVWRKNKEICIVLYLILRRGRSVNCFFENIYVIRTERFVWDKEKETGGTNKFIQ